MKVSALLCTALSAGTILAAKNGSIGILAHNGVDLGEWKESYEKALHFNAKLNISQKISIITGGSASTMGEEFPGMTFIDGSMGILEYYYVSAFSQASAIAMTWDKNAVHSQAKALGREVYQRGMQTVLGPTSQPLGRTPWGGRQGETFGPDPYLNGIITAESVKGYSEAGVVSQAKRFLLNEQENNRSGSMGSGNAFSSIVGSNDRNLMGPYSSNVDDKALHELYLWPFYDAIKNGLGSVMCAMNQVNGSASCENHDLLMKLLKHEMGFPGLVYPDMNAQRSGLQSAVGGLDYGSTTLWSSQNIHQMLKNGSVSMERLNDMVIRNIIPYYQLHLDNGKQPSAVGYTDFVDVQANHSRLIRENGAKSIVLLKNIRGALPLKKPRIISIFGSNTGPAQAGPNVPWNPIAGAGPVFEGHLATGSGSGQSSFPLLVTPQAALTSRALMDRTMMRWILNDTFSGQSSSLGQGTGGAQTYEAYSQNSDVCLVFINALAGEGKDRTELYNSQQDKMVNNVADNCNNTVVVINTVGPRLVDQWIEHENVTGVLYSSLLGQESGNSIVDVLYGDVNPSARLTYTIAKNESDYNVGLCKTLQCDFTEGIYIDYRHFDAYNVTPRYPFGYGMSYTNFSYSDFIIPSFSKISKYPTGSISVGGPADLWDLVGNLTVKITNTGDRRGAEIPQLYISYPKNTNQPIRQLRGFERIELSRNEQSIVQFPLRWRDLSYWDVKAQSWTVTSGKYTFSVGASSRDLRLTAQAVITTV